MMLVGLSEILKYQTRNQEFFSEGLDSWNMASSGWVFCFFCLLHYYPFPQQYQVVIRLWALTPEADINYFQNRVSFQHWEHLPWMGRTPGDHVRGRRSGQDSKKLVQWEGLMRRKRGLTRKS